MRKRVLSFLLTFCLALSLLPTMALAASNNPFTDVVSGSYYEKAVIWAKDTGVTGGTSATTFSPNATCTRGQVVTFLWRAKGQPEPKSTSKPFTDVKSGDYFYKPVLWAVEQGITGGTSDSTFSPAVTCTSGQVLTFLWRANGSPEAYVADSSYYAKAVSWAAEKGLLDNMGGFSATAPSPRSAIVTYLYRNAGSPHVSVDIPVTVSTKLYKTQSSERIPFRAVEEGAIIGEIPSGRLVEVLSIQEGGYAKILRNGYEVYVWADKLKQVDKPDAVCSGWAQEWLSASDGEYVGLKGAWFGTAVDYTRTITRKEMADLLVWIMEDIYGSWAVQYTLPAGTTGWNLDNLSFCSGRLVYWGVAPRSYFLNNEDKPATYGEAVGYLVKLMEYNQTKVEGRAKKDVSFTKAIVDGYGIGGNTASTTNCTYEQVRILKEKTNLWYEVDTLQRGVAYEASQYKADPSKKQYEGLNKVGTGTYTIQTYLGKEGAHPYLTINVNGEGELQSGKPQSFKLTYLGTDLRGHSYTIQTMDGKYLALDGMAVNGSRLITRSTPYRWYIGGGRGDFIYSAENANQRLNASGWNTKDGTPVISWFSNGGIGPDTDNYKFYFEYAN